MELSPVALIIWVEVTFLLTGGLLLLVLRNVYKNTREKKSVNGLLAQVQADREKRIARIRSILSGYGMQGEALQSKVDEIDKAERRLYQQTALMYSKHSNAMLSRINVAIEKAAEPYLTLGLSATVSQPAETSAAPAEEVNHPELEALNEENQRLQDELAITMETIGRMLSEYSSMFDVAGESDLDKDKIMEAFEVDEDGNEIVAVDPEQDSDSQLQPESEKADMDIDLPGYEDESLLNAVDLDEADIAELEAAGLSGIAEPDMDTDEIEKELIKLDAKDIVDPGDDKPHKT